MLRLDGSRAAANTITRKRAVFHGAPDTPSSPGCCRPTRWTTSAGRHPRPPPPSTPQIVASPAQVRRCWTEVARTRPGADRVLRLPVLRRAAPRRSRRTAPAPTATCPARAGHARPTAAAPRTAAAWTSSGTSHEQRGLKHRPDGAVRMVPVPPVLAAMLRRTMRNYGTAPDGRLFRGARGGPLSESIYGRTWHAARSSALGPELAATALARRPYDLRHAALSLWLNAGGAPAQIAAPGRQQRRRPARRLHPLHPRPRRPPQPADRRVLGPPGTGTCPSVKSQRLHRPRGYRTPRSCPPYVRERPPACARTSPPGPPTRPQQSRRPQDHRRRPFPQLRTHLATQCQQLDEPDLAHAWPTAAQPTVCGTAPSCTQKPVTQILCHRL